MICIEPLLIFIIFFELALNDVIALCMLNTSAYLRNHDYVCTLSQLVVLRDSRGRTWKQKNYCCCIWALCRLILCLLLKYAFLKNKLKLKRKTWFRCQGIRNIYNHMKCLFTTKYPWFEI